MKRYFFSLSSNHLKVILDAYEKAYGIKAREYAEETLPRWRTGSVQMSGMVASRLFNLLPPRMPIAEKYKLTQSLWKHVGPRSRMRLRVGLDAEVENVVSKVYEHIEEVVTKYSIPDNLERRFNWLSAGDVRIKQDLLNHVQQAEKSLVVEGARKQLPVMLHHIRGSEGQHTHRLAQVLKIGNHELEVLVDQTAAGVQLEDAAEVSRKRPGVNSSRHGFGWIWWFVALAVVLFLLVR
ncbi:MAG: hypothetical protein OXC01_17870 [Immundisolibacterales bacterium]|nr:hypothetical protein [Immundisolibacterales bacterium]